MKIRSKLFIFITIFILIFTVVPVGAFDSSDQAVGLSDVKFLSKNGDLFFIKRPEENESVIPSDFISVPAAPVQFDLTKGSSNTKSQIIPFYNANFIYPGGFSQFNMPFNIDHDLTITFVKYRDSVTDIVYHSIYFKTFNAEDTEVTYSRDFTTFDVSAFQGFKLFVGSNQNTAFPVFTSEYNYSAPDCNVNMISDGTYAPSGSEIPAYATDEPTTYFTSTITSSTLHTWYNNDFTFFFYLIPTYSGSYSLRQWDTGNLIENFSFYNLTKYDYSFSMSWNEDNSDNYVLNYSFSFFNEILDDPTYERASTFFYVYNNALRSSTDSAYTSLVIPVSVGDKYLVSSTVARSQYAALAIFTDSNNNFVSLYLPGNNSSAHYYTDELVTVPAGAEKMFICSTYSTPRVVDINTINDPDSSVSRRWNITASDTYYAFSGIIDGRPLREDEVNTISKIGSFPKFYLPSFSDVSVYVVNKSQYDLFPMEDAILEETLKQKAEEANLSSEQFRAALEEYHNIPKPTVEEINVIVNNFALQESSIEGIDSFSPIFATIFGNSLVLEMLILSLTFVFTGYILFGKRS